jgi:hypothetical protein
MIKTTLSTLRRTFRVVSMVIGMAAFLLSVIGTPSAFAASLHQVKSPTFGTTVHCLVNAATISDAGGNQIAFSASTTSTCGSQGIVTSGFQSTRVTNQCDGIHAIILPSSFALSFNATQEVDYTDQVGCVTCTYQSGQLVSQEFPPFTVSMTVSSTGTYKQDGQTITAADTGTASASTTVQNTGANAPQCPSTNSFGITGDVNMGFIGTAQRL